MILLFLSDTHSMVHSPKARLDDVPKTLLRKWEFVFKWAKRHKAVLLQSGDLGESGRSWHLLVWLVKLFEQWKPNLYTVYGQHDLYMHSEESKQTTILGVLQAAKLVKILDGDGVNINPLRSKTEPSIYVYGCSYGQKVPKPVRVDDRNRINILVIHRMVLSKKLWRAQTEYDWAPKFLRDHRGYDFILCGDYHYKFVYHTKDGRTILNTGCMLRKTANIRDIKHRPGFFIHDTSWEKGRIRWIPIPHESADKVLTRDHLREKETIKEKNIVNENMQKFADRIKKKGKKKKAVNYKTCLVDFMDAIDAKNSVRDFVLQAIGKSKND